MGLDEKQEENIKSRLQRNFNKNKMYTLFNQFLNNDMVDNSNDLLSKALHIEKFRFKNLQVLPSINLLTIIITTLFITAIIASAFVSLIAPFVIFAFCLATLLLPIGRIMVLESFITDLLDQYKSTDLNDNEAKAKLIHKHNKLSELLQSYSGFITFVFMQKNYMYLAELVHLEIKLALNNSKRPYMESSENVYRICKNAMQHPFANIRLIAAAIAAEWCSAADKQKFAIDAEIAANICIYLYQNFDNPYQNITKLSVFLMNGNYLTALIDYHHAAKLHNIDNLAFCEKLINVIIKSKFCSEVENKTEFEQINKEAIKYLREVDQVTFNEIISRLPFDDVKLVKNITLRSTIKIDNIILQPEPNETDLEYIIRMINADDFFAEAKINNSNKSTWLHFLLDIAANNCIDNDAYIRAIKKLIKNTEPNQRDEYGYTSVFYDRYDLLGKAGYKPNLFPGLDAETQEITGFLENLLPNAHLTIENEHGFINSNIEKQQLLILAGPPGVGKTTLPTALAKLHNFEIIEFERGVAGDKYVGGLSSRIAKKFDDATKIKSDKKGVIIFIDEIDSLLPNSKIEEEDPRDIKACVLHDLQIGLDKVKNFPIGILCATNKPEKLPESWVSRGAGLSKILKFNLPSEQVRFEILNEKLKYIPIFEEDLRFIANSKKNGSARDLTLFVAKINKVSKLCDCADKMRSMISRIENIDLHNYNNDNSFLINVLKQQSYSILNSFINYISNFEEEHDEKKIMAKKNMLENAKLNMINN